ncbi:ribonuclease D [Hahella aquimaris]|uniref:ribonuclease D n=1 Tax=Hahella sp. HNIBRBA332 TaxID=3015983 RepID=UPI00273C67CF|nr:ribonuclease D [Hahella sp. HNIBRBA332]WLQ16948.1 ribonuclease D [Hahella sp. HNIBRBA332]
MPNDTPLSAIYPPDYESLWIDTPAALQDALQRLEKTDWLAVDTEFIRGTTFYPAPALLQLYDRQCVYLVDMLKITDWSGVSRLFENRDILKVVHACSEDLELFNCVGLSQPYGMIDTQVANALLDGELNEGLQSLVRQNLGIELEKQATRSDWTQRPLTDKQIQYAQEDVVVLWPLYQKLEEGLRQSGKYEIALEEGEAMRLAAAGVQDVGRYYLKLRGGWRLRKGAQQLLAKLAAWREQEARGRDIPRKKICPDDELIAIAQRRPRTLGQLTEITSIQGAGLRRYGTELVGMVREHMQSEGDEPEAGFEMIRPPIPREYQDLVKKVKKLTQKLAREHRINVGLLASRGLLEEFVYWHIQGGVGTQPQLLQGWRGRICAAPLERWLQNDNSVPPQQSS